MKNKAYIVHIHSTIEIQATNEVEACEISRGIFSEDSRAFEMSYEAKPKKKEALLMKEQKFERGHSFFIFDAETSRMYHTVIKTNSMRDLLDKFARWDMEGDEEAINDMLAEAKTDADAEDYFRDRGSSVFKANEVEEF